MDSMHNKEETNPTQFNNIEICKIGDLEMKNAKRLCLVTVTRNSPKIKFGFREK